MTKDKFRAVFVLPVYISSPEKLINCHRYSPDGIVIKKEIYYKKPNITKKICVNSLDYEDYFKGALDYLLQNSIVLRFINQLKELKNTPPCYSITL